MVYFKCESHLDITLQQIGGLFMAKIDLRHMDNHIPYHATQLPLGALELISENKDKALKDVSD